MKSSVLLKILLGLHIYIYFFFNYRKDFLTHMTFFSKHLLLNFSLFLKSERVLGNMQPMCNELRTFCLNSSWKRIMIVFSKVWMILKLSLLKIAIIIFLIIHYFDDIQPVRSFQFRLKLVAFSWRTLKILG